MSERPGGLHGLDRCFQGAIPSVIATASADGTPNITYLSRVHRVDEERVALSNQFFSKTQRNLAENPRASVLLVHPDTFDEVRLTLAYERTERRGPVFERLREDVDALAALHGLVGVFKLRAADIYRVLHVEDVPTAGSPMEPPAPSTTRRPEDLAALVARLGRCADLDTLVDAAVRGLAALGYSPCVLLLLDETGQRLYTIGSSGYDAEGVGSEVRVGEGVIGMTAARCTPLRLGNLRQMAKYSWSVRSAYEEEAGGERTIAVPQIPEVQSRIAVPAVALGQLVGVLVVESTRSAAFDEVDEAQLTVVAGLVAHAVEAERVRDRAEEAGHLPDVPVRVVPAVPVEVTTVRYFPVDGSTFLDGDYLIKGVAGRLLWSLLGAHEREGRTEFTNREVRLDPSLELPELRDNFESRLILLKRRLDERGAPVRIEKVGRGRFRLVVQRRLRLEAAGSP